MARNRMYRRFCRSAVKILNVEKASIDKVLANAEIKTMINASDAVFQKATATISISRSCVMTRSSSWRMPMWTARTFPLCF